MSIKKTLLVGLIGAMSLGAFQSMAMAKEQIVVNGSTTVLPIMQKVSEKYMAEQPEIAIALSGGGSGNGIKALIDNLTHVAMSSRQIKSKEVELANSKSVKPNEIVVGIDALVPVVNPQNTVAALTVEQLKEIYEGKITNWKEVGGKDEAIVLVSRDSSSGTFETWEEMVMKKQRISPKALLQASNGAVVQTVAKNPKAIGYVGLGYLGNGIKAISVNGVKVSVETASNGKWPLSRNLYLYTNGAPKGEVKKLIDFTLGQKGQKLVEEAGFVPVK